MSVNFELVTEVQGLLRRDFPVADRNLVNPNNANPLMDGEFMNLDTAYKLVRGVEGSFGMGLFVERGRMDVQAIGKVTVLMGGAYEADTRVFGAGMAAVGQRLMISASVTVDTLTKSGLVLHDGTATKEIVGYVTRLPANNGGRLRFMQTLV
jgi:hypothetical protein